MPFEVIALFVPIVSIVFKKNKRGEFFCKLKIVPIVSIVVKISASNDRPRRGRISITAGEESEANVTCGFLQLSRQDVLEEGEHKRTVQIPHMFALFEDDSTIIMGDRRLRSLWQLNQRLWIFALFEDARLQAGTGRRNGLSLLSLLSLKKTRGRKTTLLFCFLFSVSCVFYITGFSQLYWFFPIVFYILAFCLTLKNVE